MNDEMAAKFLERPQDFMLFRGERPDNQGGLHFTNDREWAGSFGEIILAGSLPAGCKIKLLAETDMSDALVRGVYTEQNLWSSIFEEGYDAILGHDAMRPSFLDVIVHPKHLGRFRVKKRLAGLA